MATVSRPTVVLADDHAIVRDGIAKLLADFGFDVIGAVGDGLALIEAVKRLDPDIIITDISMPGPINGLDAVARLRTEGCRGKIIVLTMHHDADLAAQATRVGASGYLLKHSAGEELVSAIEQVLQGRVYLTPAVTRELLERLASGPDRDEPQLTPRQREVLRLIADGMRMKEIASTLGLSPRTVETHKYELMRILGVDSTATLVRYALEHGLIER
jgi:DNA-binding NarL/FixJ family response regulator